MTYNTNNNKLNTTSQFTSYEKQQTSMIKALDAFHRRQLRYALGIYYPKKISNAELYRHKTLECCCEGT